MKINPRGGDKPAGWHKPKDMTGSDQARWVDEFWKNTAGALAVHRVRESDRRLIMRRLARKIEAVYG